MVEKRQDKRDACDDGDARSVEGDVHASAHYQRDNGDVVEAEDRLVRSYGQGQDKAVQTGEGELLLERYGEYLFVGAELEEQVYRCERDKAKKGGGYRAEKRVLIWMKPFGEGVCLSPECGWAEEPGQSGEGDCGEWVIPRQSECKGGESVERTRDERAHVRGDPSSAQCEAACGGDY